MRTFIINTTLLTLCHSDTLQSSKGPSCGSTTDWLTHSFDLASEMYMSYSL